MNFKQLEAAVGGLERREIESRSAGPSRSDGFAPTDNVERLRTGAKAVPDDAKLQISHIAFHHLTHVLEGLDLAAFVQDARGQIVAANAKVLEIAGPLLDETTRSLVFSDKQSSVAFASAIETCFAPVPSRRPTDLTVADHDLGALHLQFWPLASMTSPTAIACAVLILVARARLRPEQIMARQFALTKTETRIVQELFAGETVSHIARAHNVKPDTIRTQLKSIFSKTSTGRQSQLVALYAKAHAPEAFKEFSVGLQTAIIASV